jgi:hypothetical protein
MMMNTDMIAEMEARVAELREMLEAFAAGQDDTSDEANEGHIEQAARYLDGLEGTLGDLVP